MVSREVCKKCRDEVWDRLTGIADDVDNWYCPYLDLIVIGTARPPKSCKYLFEQAIANSPKKKKKVKRARS